MKRRDLNNINLIIWAQKNDSLDTIKAWRFRSALYDLEAEQTKRGGMKHEDAHLLEELIKQIQAGGIVSPEVLEEGEAAVDRAFNKSDRRAEQQEKNLKRYNG